MKPPPKNIVEAAFQSTLIETAELLGWHVFHVNDSRREVVDRKRGVSFLIGDEQARGWPDLALAHPRWHVFAVRELKTNSAKSKTTDAQRRWLELLTLCGVDAGVWRPRDWDELIVPFLTNRRARRAA